MSAGQVEQGDTWIYLVADPDAGPKWDGSEAHLRAKAALAGSELPEDEQATRISDAQAQFEETRHIRPAVVGGRLIFEHDFIRPTVPFGEIAHLRHVAIARWRVHLTVDGGFVLVRQRRRRLSPPRAARWQESLDQIANTWRGSGLHEAAVATRSFVDSPHDTVRWTAHIEPATDLPGLLDRFDTGIDAPGRPHSPIDEVSVPFLLRKALLEHGFTVPGTRFHGIDEDAEPSA